MTNRDFKDAFTDILRRIFCFCCSSNDAMGRSEWGIQNHSNVDFVWSPCCCLAFTADSYTQMILQKQPQTPYQGWCFLHQCFLNQCYLPDTKPWSWWWWMGKTKWHLASILPIQSARPWHSICKELSKRFSPNLSSVSQPFVFICDKKLGFTKTRMITWNKRPTPILIHMHDAQIRTRPTYSKHCLLSQKIKPMSSHNHHSFMLKSFQFIDTVHFATFFGTHSFTHMHTPCFAFSFFFLISRRTKVRLECNNQSP